MRATDHISASLQNFGERLTERAVEWDKLWEEYKANFLATGKDYLTQQQDNQCQTQ